jgi:hypothetical protein
MPQKILPPASLMLPSSVKMLMLGSEWRLPEAKSFGS